MTAIRIDLRSDTTTRPSPGMRRAMAETAVGDEQRGDDPTVNRLCKVVAELLGKEDAVFLPSGTMCNLIAILVHCRRGDEILADRTAHFVNSEAAGVSAVASVMVRPLDGTRGVFSAEQVAEGCRPLTRHAPRSSMVCVEQTVNAGGGTVWPLEAIRAVAESARERNLIMHMDGARLLNAVVASGVAARDYGALFDSLWIDLSKGLGCPVGAVLAGSSDFIRRAWPWKQRLGGSMRQAGIIAAAGLYALEHNVDRLAEDHANARVFAEAIAGIPGVAVDLDAVETNIVFFDVAGVGLTALDVSKRLGKRGVAIDPKIASRCRIVTHKDAGRAQIEEAAAALQAVIANP
jgi:threonine aldolase